jgi:hypothetical protein
MNNQRRTYIGSVFVFTMVTLAMRSALSAGLPAPGLVLPIPPQTSKVQPAAASNVLPVSPYKSYAYNGDRYRDPFVSLASDIRADQSVLDRPPQVGSLTLKGIVQDAKGRMALLTTGVNSYILRGGRLYNNRNKMVKKIAGVIKTDSVVIIGADRTVRELKTKIPL